MTLAVDIPTEKWTGSIRTVVLGATPEGGGTRKRTVTVGGGTTLPFLHFEGDTPYPPVLAVEVQDRFPDDWSPLLAEAWGDLLHDPGAWAARAEDQGADLIVLRLQSAHTEAGDTGAEQAVIAVKNVLSACGLPLIVLGPGQVEKDNVVLVAAAEAAQGERVALGVCEEKNYRTIVAAALAHDQLVIASSPIDVNLAKQLNILISDMRLDLDRIIMDSTTGALGYGLEYSYSVMERLRTAALSGDNMTALPIISMAGQEAWRSKEAKVNVGVPETWGDWARRSILWEIMTATSLMHSGADILVLRHPESIGHVRKTINSLMVA